MVRANKEFILESAFVEAKYLEANNAPSSINKAQIPLLKEAKKQLNYYFEGKCGNLSLPLDMSAGTAFQRSVWLSLQKVPFGETRSYKDIAVSVCNPRGSRAVGGANNKNPFVLFVPCHRIVNKNRGLGGFGAGKWLKKWLLLLEGVKI